MTVSPTLLRHTRRASRWLAVLAAVAVLGVASAVGLMYFWVLPNIADHRDTVASLMSRALGQRVTLEAVSGTWQQARPEFRLQGVRLYDRQGRPALELPELQAAFAWRSLLFLEPRFNHIELQGLALGVRRAPDGRIYVGGIPVNPADPDSGFANWLLRQGRVHVGGATLTWQDEMREVSPLVLQDVDFTLTNVRRTHTLLMHAVPPTALARPLTVEAQLNAGDVGDLSTWSGTVKASVARVSFPHLATRVALPVAIDKGGGALTLTAELARGNWRRATADMDLRAIDVTLGDGLPPLQLTQVRGAALWQREANGRQRVAFKNLQVTRPGATASAPFDVGLAWDAGSREFSARALSLADWQTLLPSLPMDVALRERLRALQPQGRFDELRFGWRGAQPGLDNFSVAAHFSGLGVRTVEGQPGWSNLSGRIEGDTQAGTFELDSRSLVVALPGAFREPSFGFDRLTARGDWKKTQRGHRLRFDESAFANPDMAGTLQGDYEWIAGQPGVVDLTAQLSRAEGTAVYRYLPYSISDGTVNWLRDSVIAGRSDDVKMRLKGDLQQFPFDAGNGEFRVDLELKEGVIDYVSGWPRIEGIEGHVLFEGKQMTVTARQATLYGAVLSPVKAVIPDLLHHEELLHVEGQANGPIQDFIHFANTSPVGERLRGFTDGLSGSGPMRLVLDMTVPLRHSHDTTLKGKLSFLGNALLQASLPGFDQVRGDIDFTHAGLTSKGITAQFLGGPLRVEAVTREEGVQIRAQGRASGADLAAWVGPAWGKRLSGQAAWRGQLNLEPAGERLFVESDLVGLGSSLPLPLTKAASSSLPLQVSIQPQPDGRRHAVRVGNTAGAVWHSNPAGRLTRGELRFGGQAAMPTEPGLRVAGSARALDLTGWLPLLPVLPEGGDNSAMRLSSLDLRVDVLDIMGRRFTAMQMEGRTRNGLLRGQVTGDGVSGVLTYRPAGEQPARVSAQFARLTVPQRAPSTGEADGRDLEAEYFPVLDLAVEDFRLQDRPMGRLDVLAHGSSQGMVIDSLQLSHADSVFHMSGLWRDGVPTDTRAELKLNVLDAGKFLARFGYADVVARGSAEFQGNATWVGSPADFAFDTLAGQLAFKARGGQFLKIDPGAGKLLGVLSLQSLPRRLSFDFRDIFNEGYAFDDMGATLRIARGVVYSDNFQMRGPAAKVNMSGLADLNKEAVQLRVKVIPKLSESVAVAGALIAGPLAGVGALAAQKLLRDPIEEFTSQEYLVSGPWQTPDVKKLPKTRTETFSGPQMTEP